MFFFNIQMIIDNISENFLWARIQTKLQENSKRSSNLSRTTV